MAGEKDLERILDELSSLSPEERAEIMAENPDLFYEPGLILAMRNPERAAQVYPQFYDEQTKLMSKLFFEKRFLPKTLQDYTLENVPVCYAILDIDDFKWFNDKHGYAAGDKALELISTILRTNLRYIKEDNRSGEDRRQKRLTYETERRKRERRKEDRRARDVRDYIRMQEVGRVGGGEEFGVLLCGCGPEQADTILNRVREIISNSYVETEEHRDLSVTISGGYAPYSPEITAEELIENARQALYEAKRRGKNIIIGYDQLID